MNERPLNSYINHDHDDGEKGVSKGVVKRRGTVIAFCEASKVVAICSLPLALGDGGIYHRT